MGSEQWAVGRGQWAGGSGRWAVRQWAVGGGQWAVGSEWRAVGSQAATQGGGGFCACLPSVDTPRPSASVSTRVLMMLVETF